MAAASNFHPFAASTVSRRKSVIAARRVIRLRSVQLVAVTARTAAAVGEMVLLLWMVLALAFLLLVAASLVM